MGKRDDSKQVPLQRLIDMCEQSPQLVTLARRAIQEGNEHFGFEKEVDIKNFIAQNGFDSIDFKDCCESDEIPGTFISAYKFKIDKVPGYLAYHPKATDLARIHIKSFHKDALSPDMPMGTLGELFPKNILGDQNE